MEKGTQFKVDTIDELEEAYNYLKYEWVESSSLEKEKRFFKLCSDFNYVQKTSDGIILFNQKEDFKTIPNPLKEPKTRNKYAVKIKGVDIDIYDILDAHNVRNPALQHLVKKCLHGGMRGHKSREQDLKDIISSAKRAYEIEFKND